MRICIILPGTGPHTLGMISKIAEHDGSSKHSCRARMQFRMASADLMFVPVKIRLRNNNLTMEPQLKKIKKVGNHQI